MPKKQGVPIEKIGGTIQNDMLKEFIAQKTFMLPPEPSMKLISDTVEFGTKYVLGGTQFLSQAIILEKQVLLLSRNLPLL